jgi:hypothetical protein
MVCVIERSSPPAGVLFLFLIIFIFIFIFAGPARSSRR